MLAFRDTTMDVREPKSARLEQRIKPRVKEMIERAASTLGVDTSDFVVSAAYKEALSTLEAQGRTVLQAEASRAFLAAITGAAGPNDTMRKLMADYEETVENAIR